MTGQAAGQANHDERERQLLRGGVLRIAGLVDGLLPHAPAQVAKFWGSSHWKEYLRITLIHDVGGPWLSVARYFR